VAGGTSQNHLSVSFTQTSGTVSATGSPVSNSGSSTASPVTSADNTGTNSATQHLTPTLTGYGGDITQDQTATSSQRSDPSNTADNRIRSLLTQRAGGENTATSGDLSVTQP
jgi:hypothetical protein